MQGMCAMVTLKVIFRASSLLVSITICRGAWFNAPLFHGGDRQQGRTMEAVGVDARDGGVDRRNGAFILFSTLR